MSVNGFLTQGRPVHESGLAASMILGSAPARDRLYTHRFEGARSHSQIDGAIGLAFEPGPQPAAEEGSLEVRLLVDNSRTGHKMPSGSVELRYLWLEVQALVGNLRVDLTPVSRPEAHGYDVTGTNGELDQSILAGGVPTGRRIYRTLLGDRRGAPTLAFYLGKTILFDNRLHASEVRGETYRLKLAQPAPPSVTLLATMYYVAYPDAFADRLGLPKAEPVQVASTCAEIRLRPE